uniref:Uncharacterized protein n=1 Tax=Anguilla anguilla TaxID=7936 RepID=A0A0E9XTM1_ANGAN
MPMVLVGSFSEIYILKCRLESKTQRKKLNKTWFGQNPKKRVPKLRPSCINSLPKDNTKQL